MFASSLLRVIIRHPGLWPELLRVVVAFTPVRWWKRGPFLPIPRPTYVRWRLQTAYGSADAIPSPADVVHFLEWRRGQR